MEHLRSKKVLLLSSTNDRLNGYGNITHEYCQELKRRGIDFLLLLPEDSPRYDYADYPIDYVLPPYIFSMKTPKILSYLTFSHEYPADLVHSLFEFPYMLCAVRIARKKKVPLIVGGQGTYAIEPLFHYPDRWFVRRAYDAADRIIVPSQFTRDMLVKHSGTSTIVDIIHNGVNFERFNKEVDHNQFSARFGGRHVLLTVGGLKPRKGQDIALRALARLREVRDDFQYVLAGDGSWRGYLENLAQELGLSDRVTFLGSVDNDDLVAVFKSSAIYLHTPVLHDWHFEGFGIVYIEASACGIPCVATDSGGIRDAVVDGVTGLVVPDRDEVAVSAALAKLLDDETLRRSMGERGRAYAAEHAWPLIVDRFLSVYRDLGINLTNK